MDILIRNNFFTPAFMAQRSDVFLKGIRVTPEYEMWVNKLNVLRADLLEWKHSRAVMEYYKTQGQWKEPNLVPAPDGSGVVKRGPAVITYPDGTGMMESEIHSTIKRLEYLDVFLQEQIKRTKPSFIQRILSRI